MSRGWFPAGWTAEEPHTRGRLEHIRGEGTAVGVEFDFEHGFSGHPGDLIAGPDNYGLRNYTHQNRLFGHIKEYAPFRVDLQPTEDSTTSEAYALRARTPEARRHSLAICSSISRMRRILANTSKSAIPAVLTMLSSSNAPLNRCHAICGSSASRKR